MVNLAHAWGGRGAGVHQGRKGSVQQKHTLHKALAQRHGMCAVCGARLHVEQVVCLLAVAREERRCGLCPLGLRQNGDGVRAEISSTYYTRMVHSCASSLPRPTMSPSLPKAMRNGC